LGSIPTHALATAVHFPTNPSLIFLNDELTNDKYLVDTEATLSIIPHYSNNKPSGPPLKGANGLPIPSRGFLIKLSSFKEKHFTFRFLQAAMAGPILGLNFLKKFKVTVPPDTNQIFFACTKAAPASAPAFLHSILLQLPGNSHTAGAPPTLHPSPCRWCEIFR
jgi:hypothetical protein